MKLTPVSNGTGFMPIGRDHVGNTLSTTKQITDNLTYIRGKHTFRTGVDYRWVRFEVPEIETPSDDYGLFTFNGALTGNTFGDFLQGLPATTYFAVTGPRNNAGGPEMGLYGQDEWQVNSRLTVNAGLRWEWLPPFVDQHGIQANFDPIRNTVIVNNVLYRTLCGPVPAFLQSFNACNAAPPGFSAPADAGYVPSASLPCTAVVSNGQEGLPAGVRQTYHRNFDPRVSISLLCCPRTKHRRRRSQFRFRRPSQTWDRTPHNPPQALSRMRAERPHPEEPTVSDQRAFEQ